MTTLVVTNDYPPREGGIQTFVRALIDQLDSSEVAVFSSTSPGAAAYDAQSDLEVVRHPSTMLLPTPAVTRQVAQVVRSGAFDRVLFGAAAPLGLMAPALRAAGAQRIVGLTHGHETGWALLPGSRQVLARIGRGLDVTTYITDYTRGILEPAMPGTDLRRLPPGVDIDRFRPDIDASRVLARHELTGVPVIGCISRLVPRKGQDYLIRALPLVRAAVPEARLLIVGGGRDERRLRALANTHRVSDAVVFAGRPPSKELAEYYAACDVFAMPCRTRRGGLDVEGLGMVYLEAAATGVPVVAGTSGGAPEAVEQGITGTVLRDATDRSEIAGVLVRLLSDRTLAAQQGAAGRAWVEREWTWERQGERLREILAG
ncbi:glycosyltransferase [Epidermidibacterium keratini]|uniref:Glycosyltransferase n=1 Tax=Epidermidibacterium keratini TaxID=1891644 RepID=A0A7L4YJC8_9ACTN|nr:glycosyltransferase family 4 protein [Epidermidibacterium keratini]QHB99187.1 glycosyltransferase [Epidermidibacterium keratini]